MTTTSATQDVLKFARASLPSDPKKSKCFTIYEYMKAPEVRNEYGHLIRIWRTKLIPLHEEDFRRTCGLIEWTDLETGLTLGLRWTYSVLQKEGWKPIKYILHSHFPGEQPCQDLNDVYRSTTAEINWVVERLKRKHQRKLHGKRMNPGPQEGFPR